MRTSHLTTKRVAAAAAGRTGAAAPAAQSRVLCGYLRLSVDRDGNKIGYEVQKNDILAWAAASREGYTIGCWYQDKDITAADLTKNRPEYERMLADVASGMWGGVVVWRLDRLVRLTREFGRICKITEDTHTFIAAVNGSQQVDTRSPWGQFIMWLLVLLADMEIQTMKARNQAHQRAKAELGKYKGGGPRPFGFVGAVKDKDGRYLNSGKVGIQHVVHEVALLQEAARRIAWQGWGWADVIYEWHARTPPVYGSTGAPWSVYALQRVLTGPRAVGRREIMTEDPETGEFTAHSVKAEWDPIIDEKTWERLNGMLVAGTESGPKETYLLSGLLLCGRCERPLTGSRRKYRKQGVMTSTLTYRCKSGPSDKEKGSCGALNVLAEETEKLVVSRVLHRLQHMPVIVEALHEKTNNSDAALTDATDTLVRCDHQLRDLAQRHGLDEITIDEWLAARPPIEARKAAALATITKISKTLNVPNPTPDDRRDLLHWFEHGLTLNQQRRFLQLHISKARVLATGRHGPRFNPERIEVILAEPN